MLTLRRPALQTHGRQDPATHVTKAPCLTVALGLRHRFPPLIESPLQAQEPAGRIGRLAEEPPAALGEAGVIGVTELPGRTLDCESRIPLEPQMALENLRGRTETAGRWKSLPPKRGPTGSGRQAGGLKENAKISCLESPVDDHADDHGRLLRHLTAQPKPLYPFATQVGGLG